MSEILRPEGMQGDVKLIKGIGDVWARVKVYVQEPGDTEPTLKDMDIYLGCLGTNWKFTDEIETEVLPFSCKTGELTLPKGKKYKISVGIRQLPILLQAALTGNKAFIDAVSGEKVMVQETFTGTVESEDIGGETHYTLTLQEEGTPICDSDDYEKTISIYDKTTGEYWTIGDTPDPANNVCELILTSGSAPKIDFGTGEDAAAVEGDEIVVRFQYYRDMAAGDVKLVETGTDFPNTFDFVLSWLVRWENGPNKGKKGYRILKARNCMRTSAFELGGDTGSVVGAQTLEFSVNFQDEGDIEVYEGVLS